jgi:hypothetical protein
MPFSRFCALLSGFQSHSQLVPENLVLRHQLAVLKTADAQTKTPPADRLVWLGLRRVRSDYRNEVEHDLLRLPWNVEKPRLSPDTEFSLPTSYKLYFPVTNFIVFPQILWSDNKVVNWLFKFNQPSRLTKNKVVNWPGFTRITARRASINRKSHRLEN